MARILLLEDDATFRELVATAMRRAGFDVTCANDGQAGWDALATAKPDLVLLDLAMPRMDGLSFLRRLRATDEWGSVPVLVVSANSSAAANAVSMGAQGYLLKSRFSMPELLDTVQMWTKSADQKRNSTSAA